MNSILTLIAFYSSMFGIDPKIAQSVMITESNYDAYKIGVKGEIGLFQLLPKSFPVIPIEDNVYNIREGIKYLAYMKQHCPFKEDNKWVICYNTGIGGASKVRNASSNLYYLKVMKVYGSLK